MKGKLVPLFAAGSALALASAASAQAPTAQAQVALGPVAGQYVCVFKPSVARGNVPAHARAAAARAQGQVIHTYQNAVRGFAVRLPQGGIRNVRSDPSVAYCEQDQVVRALVTAAAPPNSTSTTQTTPWGITRVNAVGATYSTNRIAWVIDSGIDLDHPDLNVDTGRSRTFLGGRSTPDDQNGHGTHVAGTIAALDNGYGVVGVVPGAPVVSVRVLDRRGSGTISGVVAGVDYVAAAAQSGDVANMSLGGGASSTLDSAVANAASKGIRFTIAAGNDSAHAGNYSPARVNGTNIYTVSSFASGDKWSSFSNYGNPPVDYAEPGSGIYSTYKNGSYTTLSGTSMAAPHLAGLLMLGTVNSGGTVSGDPDGNPDTIGVH